MQRFRAYCLRFCSLAVCFALCLQPLNAYALEIDTQGSQVNVSVYDPTDLTEPYWSDTGTLDTGVSNLTGESCGMAYVLETGGFYVDYSILLRYAIEDGVRMRVSWNGSGGSWQFYYPGTNNEYKYYVHWDEVIKVQVLVDDVVCKEYDNAAMIETEDGTEWLSMLFDDVDVETGGSKLSIRLFVPNSACRRSPTVTIDGLTSSNLNKMKVRNVLTGSTLVLTFEENNDGLLAGIIEWVKRIYDGIVNLPQNIWLKIKAGMMELFVPDETFMLEYKENWDVLLSESLGGVYEAVQLVDDTAQLYLDGGFSSGQIDFPMVHIPVGENEDFTFGGWSVDILPEVGRFHVLLDALKLITNALATFYVIDALKRRFERTLEG